MSAPTVFLSAATIDLKEWRDHLRDIFADAGIHVTVQDFSLGMAPRNVRDLLARCIDEADYVFHLAGMGYGSHATDAFPDQPDFRCSWTQFEYYYAHRQGKPVFAAVLAPELSAPEFIETGADAADVALKAELQKAHRLRVESGKFTGTPVDQPGIDTRTLNRTVTTPLDLFKAIAGSLRHMRGLAEAAPQLAAALETRLALHQLPPRPVGFVGREDDLLVLRAQAASGLTAITGLKGMGGIGKTALSLVLAHELAPRFPDGQLFIECRGTSEQPPTATALHIRIIDQLQPGSARGLPDDPAQISAIYQSLLHGKKILLVLDNAAGTAQVKPLVPPAGCGLIVSSRQPLQFDKAGLVREIGRLKDDEAIALLREFCPDLLDADAQALARLCGGLPLALKLAGSHLLIDGSEPEAVRGFIAQMQRSALGTLDPEAADAGEITITETLRLSEARLTPEERDAWRALGVFTHSFEAEAAAAVMGSAPFSGAGAGVSPATERPTATGARTLLSAGASPDAVITEDSLTDEAGSPSVAGNSARAPLDTTTLLATFARRSLLERLPGGRYQMHDLAAEYARRQLSTEAEDALHLAHAQYYQRIARRADDLYLKGGAKVLEGLALFDAERPGIEAAFAWLRGKVVPSLQSSDPAEAGSSRSSRAQDESEAVPAQAEDYFARLLCDLVNAVVYTGQDLRFHPRQQRIPWLEAQRDAAQRLGDRKQEGNALGNLGIAHRQLGDARQAIVFYEQDVAIRREIGDRRGEGNALGNLGSAHFFLGDARQAIEFYEQYLTIAREIGDRRGEGNALCNLGVAHRRLGDARQAIAFYEQYLAIAREIGDRRGEGNALWNWADEEWKLGERATAIPRAQAALAIYEAIEDPNAAMVRQKLAEWGVA